MRIFVTQQLLERQIDGEFTDSFSHDLYRFLEEWNPSAQVIQLPNFPSIAVRLLENLHCDLLVLSGGQDFGEADARDSVENLAIAWAVANNVPIFGICRGLQVLNLFFGGSVAAYAAEESSDVQHVAALHSVNLNADSPPLGGSLAYQVEVNSYHRHGVLAPGLAPSLKTLGVSTDGLVEAVWCSEPAVVAVQWHPERPNSPTSVDHRLLDWLVGVKVEPD